MKIIRLIIIGSTYGLIILFILIMLFLIMKGVTNDSEYDTIDKIIVRLITFVSMSYGFIKAYDYK